jgi:hypothetical protein
VITYTIQLTKKSDCIIRQSHDGREMARFDTEPEAQNWVDQQMAKNAAETAARERQADEQEKFNRAVPDLNKMQIRWQKWRAWFYDEMFHEERRTGQFRRHLDSLDSTSYNHHEQHLTTDQEQLAETKMLYAQAVNLDGRIKTARNEKNVIALFGALNEAEAIIEQMNNYFPSSARPDDKTRSGTKPNTSLVLTDEELTFIDQKFGGRKSVAIHEALKRLMEEE